jgi:hypothetical protein
VKEFTDTAGRTQFATVPMATMLVIEAVKDKERRLFGEIAKGWRDKAN